MVQRLFNLAKWFALEPGGFAWLEGKKARNIRLEVKSSEIVNLFVLDDEDNRYFLARVVGRDAIEFVHSGTARIEVEGGSVDIYTVDGEDISVTLPPTDSFTTVISRRRLSPEFEAIAREMNANLERRLAMQSFELQRLLAARAAASSVLDPSAGVSAASAAKPPPDDNA